MHLTFRQLSLPGAIVLTRIPCFAKSRATGNVIPTIPPLEAEYAAWPRCPSNAATLAVLMITPRVPSTSGSLVAISSAKTRIQLNEPTKFTYKIKRSIRHDELHSNINLFIQCKNQKQGPTYLYKRIILTVKHIVFIKQPYCLTMMIAKGKVFFL